MKRKYDIIAMGAGHNGLVAAAYLAKAGKSVLLLERKPYCGGGVVTRELTAPGFWHDQHSTAHIMLSGNPMIANDELGLLGKFGLKYNYPEVPLATIFEDQSAIVCHKSIERTCESICRISPRDADNYARFAATSLQLVPMFVSGLYSPPVPMGSFVALLDQSTEGREILSTMHRSPLEIANEWFEDDKVKIHLLKLVTENLQMPDELGTGIGLFLMPGLLHTFGIGQPIGGSGKLTEALIRCIEHYGGTVEVNREVSKILVHGGRAVGVQTTDGEEFAGSDAVIGAIHPHRLETFVAGLDPNVIRRARRVRTSSFSLFLTHYALREPPRYYAGVDAGRGVMVELLLTSKLSEFLEDFDPLRHGRLPERLLMGGGDASLNDKTRVPPGRGLLMAQCFAPYDLAGGGPAQWDDINESVADCLLDSMRLFIANLTSDNVIARHIDTPLDIERFSPNSFVRGDAHGAAPYFNQSGAHRPNPDLGQYRVPGIERLYLVGPFMHPGGGVFGGGRCTAIRIFEDLEMSFDRVSSAVV